MTDSDNKIIIAVDGPASSGKGTLAKRLAEHFNLPYLDTGSLYRSVAYNIIQDRQNPEDLGIAVKYTKSLSIDDIKNKNLYCESIGAVASIISAFPEVREILYNYQVNFASTPKGAVLDGRDIGTVICPNADFKFFITAKLSERAKRRFKQLQNSNKSIIYKNVLEDLRRRDERDNKRNIAPLKKASDALHLDTTDIDADAVFEKALQLINKKLSIASVKD